MFRYKNNGFERIFRGRHWLFEIHWWWGASKCGIIDLKFYQFRLNSNEKFIGMRPKIGRRTQQWHSKLKTIHKFYTTSKNHRTKFKISNVNDGECGAPNTRQIDTNTKIGGGFYYLIQCINGVLHTILIRLRSVRFCHFSSKHFWLMVA